MGALFLVGRNTGDIRTEVHVTDRVGIRIRSVVHAVSVCPDDVVPVQRHARALHGQRQNRRPELSLGP